MRNVLKGLYYSLTQMVEDDKRNILILIFEITRRAGIAICMMLFPQIIVRELMEKKLWSGIEAAMLLCTSILVSELLLSYTEAKQKEIEARLKIRIDLKLSESIMQTSYENVEKKTYLEKVDFAKRCIERKSVVKVYLKVIEAIAGVISISSAFYIVFEIKSFLIAIVLLAVIISTAGEIVRLHYVYDREKKGNDVERNLYYARNELASNRYAKDIRIWHLSSYISGKVEKYAKKLCDLWSETSIKSVKILGWTYMANGIQYIVVYIFLIYMTYIELLTIDNFVLYISAITVLSNSLKDILNAIVAIGDEFKYVDGISYIINNDKKIQIEKQK